MIHGDDFIKECHLHFELSINALSIAEVPIPALAAKTMYQNKETVVGTIPSPRQANKR
jgi:hypothetical protein